MGSSVDARHARLIILRDGEPASGRTFGPAPEQCSQFHAALGLAIAIALDEAVLQGIAPEPPRAGPTSPRATPAAGPELGPSFVVHYGGLVAANAHGHGAVGLGGRVGIGMRGRRFGVRLALEGAGALDQRLGSGELRAGSLTAPVEACFGFAAHAFQLCLGPAAGLAMGKGRGFSRDERAAAPWIGAALSLSAEGSLRGRHRLFTDISLRTPFLRPEFVIENRVGSTVARRKTPAIGVWVTLGLLQRISRRTPEVAP